MLLAKTAVPELIAVIVLVLLLTLIVAAVPEIKLTTPPSTCTLEFAPLVRFKVKPFKSKVCVDFKDNALPPLGALAVKSEANWIEPPVFSLTK